MPENKNMQVQLLYDQIDNDFYLVPLDLVPEFMKVQTWANTPLDDEEDGSILDEFYNKFEKYNVENFQDEVFELINPNYNSI